MYVVNYSHISGYTLSCRYTLIGTDSPTGWGAGEVLYEVNDWPSLPYYQGTVDPRPGTVCMFY